MRRPRRGLPLAALLAAGLLAGCTHSGSHAAAGSSSTAPDAATTLATAKKTLDAANALHFTLTSDDSSKGATALVGGQGDIAKCADWVKD